MMTPFESFYGRKFQTPISWDKIKDMISIGLESLAEMEEMVKFIRKSLAEANDR